MKIRALVAVFLLALCASARADMGCGPSNPNCLIPTASAGTSNNRAASTAFVTQAINNLPTQSVSPDAYGAAGDGVTDDRLAFNAAAASFAGNGGVVALTCTKKYYISNAQIPRGVTLRGCYTSPDNPSGTNASEPYDQVGALLLSGATATTTGTTTYNSTSFVVSSAAGIVPGMSIEGYNVPAGAYVVSINGTTVTASTAATATSGATITACHVDTTSGSAYATLNGCTTANSGIAVGAVVTSANIPGATTVLGINPSNQVVLSANATGTATNTAASFANPANETYAFKNAITLGPMAGVANTLIYRSGMTFPAANSSAYSGTAFRCGYLADGCFVKDTLAIGFNTGFASDGVSKFTYANSRVRLTNFQVDAINGVRIGGSGDGSTISGLHCWPYGTVQTATAAGNYRSGYCFASIGQNDGFMGDDIFSNGHAQGVLLDASSDMQFGKLSLDFNSGGGVITGSVGVQTNANTTYNQIDQINCFGVERCIVRNANATEQIAINNVYCIAIGNWCVDLQSGDLGIGELNGYSIGVYASSPVVKITSTNSSVFIGGGVVRSINGSNPVTTSTLLRADLLDIRFQTDMANGTAYFGGSGAQPPVMAAANPLPLIPTSDEEFLNSNTTIATINGGSGNRRLRLHFSVGATLNSSGNIVVPSNTMVFPNNSWADLQWNSAYPKWILTAWGSESLAYPFRNIQVDPYTVSALPTCDANHLGAMNTVTDGAAALNPGSTISGGGVTSYLGWCNGTNWVVAGIPATGTLRLNPTTFATGLGGSSACTTTGKLWAVTDGAAALAWGANIAGGGATYYTINCNGANWTVVGK